MVVYKLHYFNLTGLGEPIRFLFTYGGLDFEDIRYEIDTWSENKKKFPLGQVPLLEMDDKKLIQSISICRYLAKQVGLAGSNDFENFEIDSVVDIFNDLRIKISTAMWEDDAEKKEKKLKLLREEQLPLTFGLLEKYAAANDGFFACKKLTWADFYIASFGKYFEFALKGDFDNYASYPNIKKAVENVLEFDSIKTYLEKRPETFC